MSVETDTPKRLRNYIRLRQNYFEHPVLMACADEVPAALHLWPVLIGKGRMSAHPSDNKLGAITTTLNRLARDAYVSIDDVAPALAKLQEGELISVSAEGQNVVRIVIHKLFPWQLMPGSPNARSDESKANASREKASLGSGQATVRQRVSIPEREEEGDKRITNTSSKAEPSSDHARMLFNHWLTATNRNGNQNRLTKQRQSKVNARLRDGYTVEQLTAAIDGIAASEWHAGGNPNGKRYDTFDFIMRSGENVEKGIEASSGVANARAADYSAWGASGGAA
jgi:hypothetical protein